MSVRKDDDDAMLRPATAVRPARSGWGDEAPGSDAVAVSPSSAGDARAQASGRLSGDLLRGGGHLGAIEPPAGGTGIGDDDQALNRIRRNIEWSAAQGRPDWQKPRAAAKAALTIEEAFARALGNSVPAGAVSEERGPAGTRRYRVRTGFGNYCLEAPNRASAIDAMERRISIPTSCD